MMTGKEVQEGYSHANISKTGGASQGAKFDFDKLLLERLKLEVNISIDTCLDYCDYN